MTTPITDDEQRKAWLNERINFIRILLRHSSGHHSARKRTRLKEQRMTLEEVRNTFFGEE